MAKRHAELALPIKRVGYVLKAPSVNRMMHSKVQTHNMALACSSRLVFFFYNRQMWRVVVGAGHLHSILEGLKLHNFMNNLFIFIVAYLITFAVKHRLPFEFKNHLKSKALYVRMKNITPIYRITSYSTMTISNTVECILFHNMFVSFY